MVNTVTSILNEMIKIKQVSILKPFKSFSIIYSYRVIHGFVFLKILTIINIRHSYTFIFLPKIYVIVTAIEPVIAWFPANPKRISPHDNLASIGLLASSSLQNSKN